uniref:Uncharacterized protein n=1 Tax=Aegilops tauschii subsp. strangulata TaxID=200361 RepID=A0A453R5A4_AEGTS
MNFPAACSPLVHQFLRFPAALRNGAEIELYIVLQNSSEGVTEALPLIVKRTHCLSMPLHKLFNFFSLLGADIFGLSYLKPCRNTRLLCLL